MAFATKILSEHVGNVTCPRIKFPSVEEYLNRVTKVQNAMQKAEIEILVLNGPAYQRYLTGLDGLPDVRPIFLVLLPNTDPTFVSPRIEAPIIRKKCPGYLVVEWGDWEEAGMCRSFWEALAKHIRDVAPNASRIENIEQFRIVDFSVLVNDIRSDNDAATLRILPHCADVAVHKFLGICKAIAPGVTEWQAALQGYVAATQYAAKHLGGDENHSPLGSSFTAMGSGCIRSAHAHSVAAGRIMEHRDLVQICCCTPPLLGHDICFDRPVVVGPAELAHDNRKVVLAAREASEAAWKMVRPGVMASEVHAAATEVIINHGYKQGMQHSTGRSIGCGGVRFRLSADDSTVLKVGDVIGIEPGVYEHGVGGARFGDTGMVVETGYEMLTPYDLGRDI